MTKIRPMNTTNYNAVYNLWINTPGMGLNTTDDSREGINKVGFVAFKRNETRNGF